MTRENSPNFFYMNACQSLQLEVERHRTGQGILNSCIEDDGAPVHITTSHGRDITRRLMGKYWDNRRQKIISFVGANE